MKSLIKGVTLGIAAFLISLVYTAPAHLAMRFLPTSVTVSELRGTLLNGHAEEVKVENFDLGKVNWTLKPLSLFLGKLKAHFMLDRDDLNGNGDVFVTFGRAGVEDAKFSGTADLLTHYVSTYGVKLNGQFDLELQSFVATPEGPGDAEGLLIWRDARLTQPSQLKLGDVRIDLSQQEDAAIGKLKNTGNALTLDGQLELKTGWEYLARIKIEPTRSTPKDVRQTLKLFGRTDSKGAVTLTQNGNLAALFGR
jgi:general secretion pathway protein N